MKRTLVLLAAAAALAGQAIAAGPSETIASSAAAGASVVVGLPLVGSVAAARTLDKAFSAVVTGVSTLAVEGSKATVKAASTVAHASAHGASVAATSVAHGASAVGSGVAAGASAVGSAATTGASAVGAGASATANVLSGYKQIEARTAAGETITLTVPADVVERAGIKPGSGLQATQTPDGLLISADGKFVARATANGQPSTLSKNKPL